MHCTFLRVWIPISFLTFGACAATSADEDLGTKHPNGEGGQPPRQGARPDGDSEPIERSITLDGLNPTDISRVLGASSRAGAPAGWRYPEEGTLLPSNLYGISFQWDPASPKDAYLLRFEGPRGYIQVMTVRTAIVLDAKDWDDVARLGRNADLKAKLFAFDRANPTDVAVSVRSFSISQAPLNGALYYWSSKGDYAPVAEGEDKTAPRGYFRYDFSATNAAGTASSFLGFNRSGNRCVGCHSLSRDGTLFATSFAGDTHWATLSVASSPSPMVTWDQGGPTNPSSLGNFSAFANHGRTLIVTDGSSLKAFAVGRDVPPIGTLTTPRPASHVAVSPADDSIVVYVEDVTGNGGTNVAQGRIVRTRWDAGTNSFVDRQVLIEDPGASVYYPDISPDGAWLLYNRTEKGSSLSNPDAELWAAPLNNPSHRLKLARANKSAHLSNSWPRWAPFSADDGNGHPRYFFTFSSIRGMLDGPRNPQLWLSSFDPTASGDPSSPALWIPVQNPALNNHAGQWTEKLVAGAR